MNEYWNNLRPLEKRLVIVVGSALFVVLNLWFVVPHFSDWANINARDAKAHKTLDLFQTEIGKKKFYEDEIGKLEGRDALTVAQEDQMTHFSTAIQSEAARSGFIPTSTGKIRTETNQFFLELSQNITVVCKEQQLVDFLYNLGSGTSLIRVRDLGLHTDPPRQQLMATIKLVASYQRKLPSKSTPATTTQPKKTEPAPATPAANKPATKPSEKPAATNKKKS